ncbi:integrase core domain-containing protein, partial [Leekyejoonella antrihumi]
AWIESFFGHLKGENPYLDTITDPAVMRRELDVRREHYNTIRLHEGIGYVTPADEHHGRGDAIRKARRDGLHAARAHQIATRRKMRHTTGNPSNPNADN